MATNSKAGGTAPAALNWELLPLEAEASQAVPEVPPADEELWELYGEAGCKGLDGGDAWMSEVPGDVLFDYLDRLEEAQPPDALPGIVPRQLGDGAGFDAGGVADRLPPGVTLAGLAADEWETGLGRLSDDEVVGVLLAWRRLNSWTVAGEAAAVAELDRRRTAQVAAGADPHLAEHVGDELAVALTLTARSADGLLQFACGLARLPRVAAALRAGQIDRAKALVIVTEVACLDDSHATAVAAAVIGHAPQQTTGQLGRATRRAVLAADPAAARKHREKAQKDARVEVWDESSGTAALAGRDLPPADVLAADRRIDTLARHLKAAGHQGTLDQLRARVYTALLLGQPTDTPPPPARTPPAGQPTGPASSPGHAPSPEEPTDQAPPLAYAPPTDQSAGSIAPGLRQLASPSAAPPLGGSVNLTMPLLTWLGTGEAPGEAAGFGPIPASDARDLASMLIRQPGSRWCLTLTDATGRPAAHGCAFAGRIPRSDCQPATTPANTVSSHPAASQSNPGQADSWELTVTIRPLAVDHCDHQRECPGYRPSPGLRHIINIRDRTCSFPGCRRPAVRCDHDHTIPYDEGGRTCECNLSALCRRHHQAKQAQGWHLDHPEPGILAWQLPHGRSYRVGPDPYPGQPSTHAGEARSPSRQPDPDHGEARSPSWQADLNHGQTRSLPSQADPNHGQTRSLSNQASASPRQARPPP